MQDADLSPSPPPLLPHFQPRRHRQPSLLPQTKGASLASFSGKVGGGERLGCLLCHREKGGLPSCRMGKQRRALAWAVPSPCSYGEIRSPVGRARGAGPQGPPGVPQLVNCSPDSRTAGVTGPHCPLRPPPRPCQFLALLRD